MSDTTLRRERDEFDQIAAKEIRRRVIAEADAARLRDALERWIVAMPEVGSMDDVPDYVRNALDPGSGGPSG